MPVATGGVSTKLAANEISGHGAGISACAHACVALGGQMSLESVRGKGATFRFSFPADRGDSDLMPAASAGPAVTRSTLTS